jgi:hypothetical protein
MPEHKNRQQNKNRELLSPLKVIKKLSSIPSKYSQWLLTQHIKIGMEPSRRPALNLPDINTNLNGPEIPTVGFKKTGTVRKSSVRFY